MKYLKMVGSLIMIFLKHLELLVLWKFKEPLDTITNPKYHVWPTLKDSKGGELYHVSTCFQWCSHVFHCYVPKFKCVPQRCSQITPHNVLSKGVPIKLFGHTSPLLTKGEGTQSPHKCWKLNAFKYFNDNCWNIFLTWKP